MAMLEQNKGSYAQSISEYVILIGIISLALIGIQTYMKRGIQAAIKLSADEIGRQEDAEEIDPLKGTKSYSIINTSRKSKEVLEFFKGGEQRREIESRSSSKGDATYILPER